VASKPGKGDGFTLIELLVVIAIIGLLAGMLLPALSRAKFASLNASCKSNVRQMAIAMTLYADDHDSYPYSQDAKQQMLWYDFLRLYCANSSNLFSCAAYRGNRSGAIFWSGDIVWYRGGSYAYNGYGSVTTGYSWASFGAPLGLGGAVTVDLNASASPPVTPAMVKRPDDMIAMGDSMQMPFGEQTGFLLSLADGARPSPLRHNGGSNIGFADGHVVSMLNSRLVETNDVALRRWNRDHEPH
jgi:prepilin-type N-terminal cleavage/methylation domain-containing protein/prepilin-type processing-associated H-X9-DG protein